MFVRTASDRDIEAISRLLSAGTAAGDRHSPGALRQRLDQPLSEFLVVDDGHRLLGMGFASAVDGGRTVLLHQIHVDPGCRGQGVGTLILDEIEGCFPDADRIRLEIEAGNEWAVAFCTARGFTGADRRVDGAHGDSGLQFIILEKPIVWAD